MSIESIRIVDTDNQKYGFLYGLWPIAWIIIMSVFLYKISV
ncbi:hypothetical protein GH844_26875, partial [Bacillus thuringiensis]|nr:hypothetical protein [Bacillus thuringiensis]